MYTTADSPASSSDLYSVSEPENVSRHTPPSAPREILVASCESLPRTHNQTEGPEERGSLGLDKLNASSSTQLQGKGFDASCYKICSGRDVSNGYHKRKREQDSDTGPIIHRSPSGLSDSPLEASNGCGATYTGVFPQDHRDKLVSVPENKRTKYDGDHSSGSEHGNFSLPTFNGRFIARLPAELWQHVFCFVPPVFLGRLLRVNHAFNKLLTPDEPVETQSRNRVPGRAKPLSAEMIWAASRKRFCPGLPKPIRRLHELDMWRLLRGDHCQVCGDLNVTTTLPNSTTPWESGPGETGVRVIWPFGIRCCGRCLLERSEKEVTLLLSSTFPSILLPALPFAFISQSNNFITSLALRNTTPPSNLQLTKHYYKPHIEEIKRQLDTVRDLGSATAEEWIKGLESEGTERMNDVSRWEQWDAKGGLRKVNIRHTPKGVPPSGPNAVELTITTLKTDTASNRSTPQIGSYSDKHDGSQGASTPVPMQAVSATFPPSHLFATPSHDVLPQRPQASFQHPRPERSIRDVNEAKAARRAEIERRCMALDPPLLPNVLHHMESFQAAIQISTALTDTAWEVLIPRLLAQRDNAERREHERIQQGKILQAKSEERRQQEAQLKEAKETLDKEWDAVQTPIRNQLAAYADEIIDESWSGGKSITKDTCPKFAADVLLYARRRFYDDLAQVDSVTRAAGGLIRSDSPNEPPTRKLILENMKWLFDNKIKILTEHFQKELFLCNGCDGNFKFYGFEGVIQHYAAKHTTSLSMGSVVVHWRAEWPEHPPFHPNPSAAKAAYYAIPMPMSSNVQGQFSMAPHTNPTYGGYGQAPVVPLQMARHGNENTQFSAGAYQMQYQGNFQEAPYPPPSVPGQYPNHTGFHGHPQAYPPGSHYGPDQVGIHYASTGPLNGYNGYQNYSSPYVPPAYPAHLSAHEPETGFHSQGPRGFPSRPPNLPPKPMQPQIVPLDNSRRMPGSGVELYQLQMIEMAKHARDVWFGTSGIKDIPQSVRIYVVIHHMVSRFEARYTNEPSLAMFIDGLDHNSLMRPVRSLNGLACKTCVTGGNGSGAGFHSHPQLAVGDRKLYTLPHLLNHFKAVHVERAMPTVHSQTGLETPRLDWKTDMIELPETPLIADLINAPGMDDAKLQLIAWVFPGVFPSPLPRLGPAGNVGPVPRFYGDYNAGVEPQPYTRDAQVEPVRTPPYGDYGRHNDLPNSRPYSAFRPMSRSTARTSEPPGEDEYDPHRPAHLGKIVNPPESKVKPPRALKQPPQSVQQRATKISSQNEYSFGGLDGADVPNTMCDAAIVRLDRGGDYTQHHSRQEDFRPRPRTPPSRPLPFYEDSKRSEFLDNFDLPSNTTPDNHSLDGNYKGTHRHVSEDGEVVEDQPRKRDLPTASPMEGFTAAEKFLNDFNPGLDVPKYRRGVASADRGAELDDRPLLREADAPHSRSRDQYQNESINLLRAGEVTDRARSLRVTPIRTDLVDPRNSEDIDNAIKSRGLAQMDVHRRSTSHARLSIAGGQSDRRSPDIYSSCGVPNSVIPHDSYALAESHDHQLRNRHSRNPGPQIMHYRSRSRSPQPIPHEAAYYRTRSPMDAVGHQPMYHIRSPQVRKDMRPQRIADYDPQPPHDGYMYVRDRDYLDGQHRSRVEYIPIRAEDYDAAEQTHYVVAQPIEQRTSAGHVRFQRDYGGERVYERDGQLYYAEPTLYGARQSRPPPPLPSGYEEYSYQDHMG